MPRKKPYPDDASYLEAELDWIAQRCTRIHAKRSLAEAVDRYPLSDHTNRESNRLTLFAWGKRKTDAHRHEVFKRQDIDDRRASVQAAGRTLGLDRLCDSHGLEDRERTLLLLAGAAALDRSFETLFADLGSYRSDGRLCPEVVFEFLELGVAQRIRARQWFGPETHLIRQGLITLTPEPAAEHPALLEASIRIRGRALGAMLGRTAVPI